MSAQCVDAARVLDGVVISFSTDLLPTTMLPFNVDEIVITDVTTCDSTDSLVDDKIVAPMSSSADDVALTPAEAHVRAGAPAVFHVAPISSALLQECVLTALASGMDVRATLHIESLAAEQLSVDIKAAVTLNCVLLTVAVPPCTPDGSLVIINNVWVAGCAVVLNELLSCVTIGFNHVLEWEGVVYAAAAAGDTPGLIVAIHKGESTEQKDTVSTGGVCALHNMSVVILHSLYYRMAILLC
jgi:hypothetical protein